METYNRVTQYPENITKLPAMSVFQLYRVQMAMVEKKVFDNRRAAVVDEPTRWVDEHEFEKFNRAITSINVSPQRIGSLIKSISNFKYREVNYVPLFPVDKFDNQNRLIPYPEGVRFTSIRRVVEYLADPRSSRQIRTNFRAKNPLPGAQWGPNDILINPDDIMPLNYTEDSLLSEVYIVKDWIERATSLKSVASKWFAAVDLINDHSGYESILVSNTSGTLKIEGDVILGSVDMFWCCEMIPELQTFYGVYTLAGECASLSTYVYPNYCLRERSAAGFLTRRNYKEVVAVVEA